MTKHQYLSPSRPIIIDHVGFQLMPHLTKLFFHLSSSYTFCHSPLQHILMLNALLSLELTERFPLLASGWCSASFYHHRLNSQDTKHRCSIEGLLHVTLHFVCMHKKYVVPFNKLLISGINNCKNNPRKSGLGDRGFDSLRRSAVSLNLVFSLSTLCLLEIQRLYPSSPRPLWREKNVTHPPFPCSLPNSPLQFCSTWQALFFLKEPFYFLLPLLHLISFKHPLRA